MALWGKQADDDCDSALMSQKRFVADAVVWLQVLSTHTGLHHISGSDIEMNESDFSRPLSLSVSPPLIHSPFSSTPYT